MARACFPRSSCRCISPANPATCARIKALGERYGFRIIEDAAHAVGGKYLGAPIGDCRYCDIAVFSFHPVKIITTGEGGAALTNDAELAARMARLRSHGTTHDPARMQGSPDGAWYYEVGELGWNYRMTDIQAALGLQPDRAGPRLCGAAHGARRTLPPAPRQ